MSILNIKPKEVCKFDCISLGEIMLRFDPGEGRRKSNKIRRKRETGE